MILEKLVKPSLECKNIITFEAYKTRYYIRTTHIKTKIQHTYPQAYATLNTEAKEQVTSLIYKVQINNNHHNKQFGTCLPAYLPTHIHLYANSFTIIYITYIQLFIYI